MCNKLTRYFLRRKTMPGSEELKKLSRRKFLQGSVGASAAALGSRSLRGAQGANERIRIGVLGTGHRAQYLMTLFNDVPSAEIVAGFDISEARRAERVQRFTPGARRPPHHR